jgi:hypothetical protein
MFKKIVRLSYWLVPVLFFSLCPVVALAQGTAAPEKQDEKAMQKPAGHTQSVTGCLQKGDEPGEFAITGEDGKTWGLYSKTVKLAEHVGHKVTVTGSPTHESEAKESAQEKKEEKMEKAAGKEEIGDLRVTNLKMVSETCTK